MQRSQGIKAKGDLCLVLDKYVVGPLSLGVYHLKSRKIFSWKGERVFSISMLQVSANRD